MSGSEVGPAPQHNLKPAQSKLKSQRQGMELRLHARPLFQLLIRSYTERPQHWEVRLITDLSFLTGKSVNDGVDSILCSFVYTTVDEVVIQTAALLAEEPCWPRWITRLLTIDLSALPRLCPPRYAVDMTYVDSMLPFGL